MDAEPERAAHSTQPFALVQVTLMRPLQRIQLLVVAAEHVRDRREELEVIRRQRSRPIDTRQRLVGLHPRPLRVQVPAAFELTACHTSIVPARAIRPRPVHLDSAPLPRDSQRLRRRPRDVLPCRGPRRDRRCRPRRRSADDPPSFRHRLGWIRDPVGHARPQALVEDRLAVASAGVGGDRPRGVADRRLGRGVEVEPGDPHRRRPSRSSAPTSPARCSWCLFPFRRCSPNGETERSVGASARSWSTGTS